MPKSGQIEIIFGMEFDGPVIPPRDFAGTCAGRLCCGPLEFLGQLEKIYGFCAPDNDKLTRTARLEAVLHKYSTKLKDMFFYSSFQVSSFSTAYRLLAIRDELLMSSPCDRSITALAAVGGRPADMAALEEMGIFAGQDGSEADRLRSIISEIRRGRIPGAVSTIYLRDRIEEFSPLWRDLMHAMQEHGTVIKGLTFSAIRSSGDLAAAQSALQPEFIPVAQAAGDGSLMYLSGDSMSCSADLCTAVLSVLAERDESTVIIMGPDFYFLNDSMQHMGLPSAGLSEKSPLHGISGLLASYLRLCWYPADPDQVLDYLNCPVCPVDSFLRSKLINALNSQAAVNSPPWQKAVTEYTAKYPDDPSIRDFLSFGSFRDVETADVAQITSICTAFNNLADNMINKLKDKESFQAEIEEWQYLAEACKTVAELIEMGGAGQVSRESLQLILSHLLGDRRTSLHSTRLAGSPDKAVFPSALMKQADNVIWWQAMSSAMPGYERPLWNNSELKVMASLGFDLGWRESRQDAYTRFCRDAARLAGKRLVLIGTESAGDSYAQPLPLWWEMMRGFEDDSAADLLRFSAADIGSSRGRGTLMDDIRGLLSAGTPMAYRERPAEWQSSLPVPSPQDGYSASSLEKLISCPMAWALDYGAGLREATIIAAQGSVLLMGNIAHAVLEEFLQEIDDAPAVPQRKAAQSILRGIFDRVISTAGEIYLSPEYKTRRESLFLTILEAAEVLRLLCRDGDYRLAAIEKFLKAESDLGTIKGYMDVGLKKLGTDDLSVIIDLKWGRKSDRARILKEGRAVQLAVYSYTAGGGRWLPAAYLIVSSAALLAVRGTEVFPGAVDCSGQEILQEKDVWERVLSHSLSVRDELDRGLVRRGLSGAEVKEDTYLEAQCKYCPFTRICGTGDQR